MRIAAIVRSMQAATDTAPDRKLNLSEVLGDLVADGIVGRAEADKLVADRRMQRADHHPLAVIADQKWKSLLPPNKLLHLELLTEWLAARVGLGYFHIDPLKINFSAVTDVMSNAYAQRFKILPVEVNTKEAVIATCEPYIKEWERELKPILRLEIRRVIANPLDIAR
ncbi:MAG: type II/IV secretion system protein, partial [Burkholderiales bacterium]|nr:type II/IV secretion system protein [Burkholderiales bacterium]